MVKCVTCIRVHSSTLGQIRFQISWNYLDTSKIIIYILFHYKQFSLLLVLNNIFYEWNLGIVIAKETFFEDSINKDQRNTLLKYIYSFQDLEMSAPLMILTVYFPGFLSYNHIYKYFHVKKVWNTFLCVICFF